MEKQEEYNLGKDETIIDQDEQIKKDINDFCSLMNKKYGIYDFTFDIQRSYSHNFRTIYLEFKVK